MNSVEETIEIIDLLKTVKHHVDTTDPSVISTVDVCFVININTHKTEQFPKIQFPKFHRYP